jgi:hypothetical protein
VADVVVVLMYIGCSGKSSRRLRVERNPRGRIADFTWLGWGALVV